MKERYENIGKNNENILEKNETIVTSVLAVILSFLVVGILLLSTNRNQLTHLDILFVGHLVLFIILSDTVSRVIPFVDRGNRIHNWS